MVAVDDDEDNDDDDDDDDAGLLCFLRVWVSKRQPDTLLAKTVG